MSMWVGRGQPEHPCEAVTFGTSLWTLLILLEVCMDISRVHDRFCSVVSKIDKAITSIEKNVYKVLVLYFFGKSWKTVRSIHLLCTHRFAEDAGILARSLFDLVVTFLYIAKAPSERALPEDPW